eukprot:gene8954-12075_t
MLRKSSKHLLVHGRRFSAEVFDKSLKLRQRKLQHSTGSHTDYYEYLRKESANRLIDRLRDISMTFPIVCEISSYRGQLVRSLIEESSSQIDDETTDNSLNDLEGNNNLIVGGIKELVQCDVLYSNEENNNDCNFNNSLNGKIKIKKVKCDEEEKLPFEDGSFDLVLSSLSLHWVNNIPSTLVDIKRILRPDGAFIASMLGGNTLKELRYCFYLAEQERKGGLSPHASPMTKVSDMAGLMQGAGFRLPTIDVDTVQISYPDAFTLMEHLFYMGESTAALNRQYSVGKDTFLAMAALYQELYGLEDGSVVATFEIIYLIGWSPHDSQPKPCKRGSAQMGHCYIITFWQISYNFGKQARECRSKKRNYNNNDLDDNNNEGGERDAGRRINLVTTALSGANNDDEEQVG